MRNIDYISLSDAKDSYEVLPNGFLNIDALLTRTGVFTYQKIDPDGTVHIIRQLRPPEEVFSEETMASMAGLPITNNHPEELVNPSNASDLIVGMASDKPKRVSAPVQRDDEEYVKQKLTFMDSGIIDLILSGDKKELSLGYTCRLEDSSGMYKGQPYDYIQRDIRINHGSLVREARGGENCKVLLDGVETVVNLDGIIVEDNTKKLKECVLKKFTYGGKEINVEDDVHALLTSLTQKLADSDLELVAKDSVLEKLQGKYDELEQKSKTLNQDSIEKAVSERVRARVALESKASAVLGSEVTLDSLTDREVKEKVILKLRPDVKLDGRSDDYIDGRFEMSIEDQTAENKDSTENTADKLGKSQTNRDAKSATSIADEAKKKAWDRAQNAWKGDK